MTIPLQARHTITSCAWQKPAVDRLFAAVLEQLRSKYEVFLDQQLRAGSAADPDARLDALARYVMFGGASRKPKTEIAAILGLPVDWPGFFWNPPKAP